MVEAERRGQEIEKKLDTDSVGAETACLIVKHYGDGGGTRGGPLGAKDTTKWLNSRSYRIRSGAIFDVVHKILTDPRYSTGPSVS